MIIFLHDHVQTKLVIIDIVNIYQTIMGKFLRNYETIFFFF